MNGVVIDFVNRAWSCGGVFLPGFACALRVVVNLLPFWWAWSIGRSRLPILVCRGLWLFNHLGLLTFWRLWSLPLIPILLPPFEEQCKRVSLEIWFHFLSLCQRHWHVLRHCREEDTREIKFEFVTLNICRRGSYDIQGCLSEGAHLLLDDMNSALVTVCEIKSIYDRIEIHQSAKQG